MAPDVYELPAPASLPGHVAIVMDGNGRWAYARGQARYRGHQAGARAAESVIETSARLGISTVSLFAFSSENWQRPVSEVQQLMKLFRRSLKQAVPELDGNGVRIRFIGARDAFPSDLQRSMGEAESRTADNRRLLLNIAAGYGGRWDVVAATRQLAREAAEGRLAPAEIDEETVRRRLSLADVTEPDLFIRTGGERRVSNFFLWQLAYTELYFTDTLWPDFDQEAYMRALEAFAARDRRFGRVLDGINKEQGHA